MLRRTIMAENRRNHVAAPERDISQQNFHNNQGRCNSCLHDNPWYEGRIECSKAMEKLLQTVAQLERNLAAVSAAHSALEEKHFALCAAVARSAFLMPKPHAYLNRNWRSRRFNKSNWNRSHGVEPSDSNSGLVGTDDESATDEYDDEDGVNFDKDEDEDEDDIDNVNQTLVEEEEEKEGEKQQCSEMIRARLCRRSSSLGELAAHALPTTLTGMSAFATSTSKTGLASSAFDPKFVTAHQVVDTNFNAVDKEVEQTKELAATRKLSTTKKCIADTTCKTPQRPPMLHITNMNVGEVASAASSTATAAFLRRSSFFREATTTPLASNTSEAATEVSEDYCSNSARGATPHSAVTCAHESRNSKVARLFPCKSFKENASAQWRRKSTDSVLKRQEEIDFDPEIYNESYRQQLV